MLRRILLATVMVAASTTMAIPAANAAPATQQCPTSNGTYTGVKVPLSDLPVTISVTDTTTAPDSTDVVVTFINNGTGFTLTSAGSDTFTSASWCVKSSTATTTPLYGTGTTGSTASNNKKDRAQKIGYVTVYSVTTAAPVQPCYEARDDITLDFRLTAALGTYLNATGYPSRDGTCSGSPLAQETVVSAIDQDAANSACAAVRTGSSGRYPVTNFYPTAPVDYWFCTWA